MPNHIFIPAISFGLITFGYLLGRAHAWFLRPRRLADAAWKQAYIKDSRNLPITDR
jgi:hypothetical protein